MIGDISASAIECSLSSIAFLPQSIQGMCFSARDVRNSFVRPSRAALVRSSVREAMPRKRTSSPSLCGETGNIINKAAPLHAATFALIRRFAPPSPRIAWRRNTSSVREGMPRTGSSTIFPLPVRSTGRGWPKAGRGALFARCIAAAFAPHPALRATFFPLCGEKDRLINKTLPSPGIAEEKESAVGEKFSVGGWSIAAVHPSGYAASKTSISKH